MSAPKVRPSLDELRRLYVEEGLSQTQIAARFGVHQTTVSLWLAQLSPMKGIPSRGELAALYKQKSTWELAEHYDVTQTMVRRWLSHYAIPRRSYRQNKMPTKKGGSHDWGVRISQGLYASDKTGKTRGRVGELAPNWRGGIKTDPETGRVSLWSVERHRYFPRAWIVWQETHPDERITQGNVIHHIDSDPTNDAPENLVKLSAAQHITLHRKQEREHIVYLEGLLRAAGIEFQPMHEHTD